MTKSSGDRQAPLAGGSSAPRAKSSTSPPPASAHRDASYIAASSVSSPTLALTSTAGGYAGAGLCVYVRSCISAVCDVRQSELFRGGVNAWAVALFVAFCVCSAEVFDFIWFSEWRSRWFGKKWRTSTRRVSLWVTDLMETRGIFYQNSVKRMNCKEHTYKFSKASARCSNTFWLSSILVYKIHPV